MNAKTLSISLIAGISGAMFSAQAATFTFGLSLDGEANAFQSVDGIGLTVENASIVGLGAGLFVSTVDGIVLSDSAAGNVQSHYCPVSKSLNDN